MNECGLTITILLGTTIASSGLCVYFQIRHDRMKAKTLQSDKIASESIDRCKRVEQEMQRADDVLFRRTGRRLIP